MQQRSDILLLNLNAFSQTGGIEKVSRVLAKAFYEISREEKSNFLNLSLYDKQTDTKYCPESVYKAYFGRKIRFILDAVKAGKKSDLIVLTHINLAVVALLIRLINPKSRIILFAHGIEIWRKLSFMQKLLLKKLHLIFAVSKYTKERLSRQQPGIENRVKVLNNCLDPFFQIPEQFEKADHLLKKYDIKPDEKVLLTLCRLSSSEKYKGYDQVIRSLATLNGNIKWKYLIMGKSDAAEKERILDLVQRYQLHNKVLLTGFIQDEEITAHFLSGDLFVMPSTDEGFGIVFIEAQACGLKVLAGNQDGSRDAVRNETAGLLIDPSSEEELTLALKQLLETENSIESKKAIQHQCLEYFSYTVFKENLRTLIKAAVPGTEAESQHFRHPEQREVHGGRR